MNKRIWKSVTAGLVCCLIVLLCGCDDSIPKDKDTDKFIIQLKMPPALEVVTKANTLDEISIGDVWVLQYNKGGNDLLNKSKYTNIGDAQNNQTIVVETKGFRNEASDFYVIANAGSKMTNEFNGSAGELKQLTKEITPGAGDQPNCLSAGPIAYDPKKKEETPAETPATTSSDENTDGGTSGEASDTPPNETDPSTPDSENDKAIIVAPLQRAFAKINIIWNQSEESKAKGTVEITKVEAANLPTEMAFYSRGGGALSATYPSNVPKNVTTIGGSNLAPNTVRTFYMAENLRGMGTGTTFAEKNQTDKGPNISLEGCTYILLSGEYTYKTGISSSAAASIGVQYKIYLGGNLKNDYNIQRGNAYTLTVNIDGANSADLRVSITDGNVAIFDEVETITNEITF